MNLSYCNSRISNTVTVAIISIQIRVYTKKIFIQYIFYKYKI